MSYIPPITADIEVEPSTMAEEIIDGIEHYVYKQIMNVSNIKVDEEELKRALNYDRGQYEKGYRDGWRERGEIIIRCSKCRYFEPMSHNMGRCVNYGLNSEGDRILTPIMHEDSFCSEAEERKENE